MIDDYLQQLGFDEKERTIYLVLAEIGVQPASVVARRCKLDRVTTYKHLKKLGEQGFVKIYFRDGVQCFGIESFDAIEKHLKDKSQYFSGLIDNLPTAMNILKSLQGGEEVIPKLQLFEGDSGIQGLFRDMLYEIKHQEILQIRILNSNTFEEKLNDPLLNKAAREFFEELKEHSYDVELFEATGGLVPEHLRILPFEAIDFDNLPVALGTTNIFLVGSIVYVGTYKSSKIGLKIVQSDLSQIFHFLFDLYKKQDALLQEAISKE